MALWQYHFHLFPVAGKTFSSTILDSRNSTDIFSKELPRGKSWSKHICIFGREDATCVEVLVNNGAIEEISVRLDLRSITEKQLLCIAEFAAANQLVTFYENESASIGQSVTVANMLAAIKKSPAYAFVKDPYKFLAEMDK